MELVTECRYRGNNHECREECTESLILAVATPSSDLKLDVDVQSDDGTKSDDDYCIRVPSKELSEKTSILKTSRRRQLHTGVRCKECGTDVVGFRFICLECAQLDMCSGCVATWSHAYHYLLGVPAHKPHEESTRLIKALRAELQLATEEEPLIKTEIKEEIPDSPDTLENAMEPMKSLRPHPDNEIERSFITLEPRKDLYNRRSNTIEKSMVGRTTFYAHKDEGTINLDEGTRDIITIVKEELDLDGEPSGIIDEHTVGQTALATPAQPAVTLKPSRPIPSRCRADQNFKCIQCPKVFATKTRLRAHRRIHNKKHSCPLCVRKFFKVEEMQAHIARVHDKDPKATTYKKVNKTKESTETEFAKSYKKAHETKESSETEFVKSYKKVHETKESSETEIAKSYKKAHETKESSETELANSYKKAHETKESSETEIAKSLFEGVMSTDGVIGHDWKIKIEDDSLDENEDVQRLYEIQKADSVIAKVMSNKWFLVGKMKRSKLKHISKVCEVCRKPFDRLPYLKRHLIEHIARSTLIKTPVTRTGSLTILCAVCQRETFNNIDRYKSHLREHAHLRIYKCSFCTKTFSDSSNFCKHKKVHGSTHFQCDLCKRKFNSKRALIKHLEYHNKNEPLPCLFCEKVFYFESTLKKHIKGKHIKVPNYKYRCKFCQKYLKSVKEKWDHEWHAHKVRKMVVDCNICGEKFRKYLELKKHCTEKHNVGLPTAKKLLKVYS